MLTLASRLDAMQRLGRAMADPTRSRILLSLLACPAHPVELANALDLTRSNVSNHLACLRGCGIVVAEPGEAWDEAEWDKAVLEEVEWAESQWDDDQAGESP